MRLRFDGTVAGTPGYGKGVQVATHHATRFYCYDHRAEILRLSSGSPLALFERPVQWPKTDGRGRPSSVAVVRSSRFFRGSSWLPSSPAGSSSFLLFDCFQKRRESKKRLWVLTLQRRRAVAGNGQRQRELDLEWWNGEMRREVRRVEREWEASALPTSTFQPVVCDSSLSLSLSAFHSLILSCSSQLRINNASGHDLLTICCRKSPEISVFFRHSVIDFPLKSHSQNQRQSGTLSAELPP